MGRFARRSWLYFVAVVSLSLVVAGAGLATTTPQTLPFSQNWSNTTLITANDDWSGVPGIEGFLGQDLTTSTGTDPQTITTGASGLSGDLTVLANQTSTAITNGDVGEFHTTSQAGAPGSDSTIGLQGSGTADAPHLIIHLDTTGQSNINVAYNLRDIDCTTDNAVQPVALQYRVGASGSFTNIPAGFVSDATTGPSLCTTFTPVSAPLPAAANNQAEVDVRIMTTNAVGSDEWVGVDDISITAPPTAAVVRSLSATAGRHGVAVHWRTAFEAGLLGFNVYRGQTGTKVRVNAKLIRASERLAGRAYSWRDRAGHKGARYWLQLVGADGSALWRGPVRAG